MVTKIGTTKAKCTGALLGAFLMSLPMATLAASTDGQDGGLVGNPRPVTMINSNNGVVYAKGTYGVILKYFTFDQDELYNGTDSISYMRPGSGTTSKKAKSRSCDQGQMILRAGLLKNLDARLIIPYLHKKLDRQTATADFSDSNSGIGDIRLISRYRLLSQKQKDPFNLAIGIGLKMPTGDTDDADSNGGYPGFVQAGSGSWDPIIELGMHKVIGKNWFSTNYMYQMTTEGELGSIDIEQSDVFKYNFGYAYAINNYLDLELELNGEVKSKAEKNGVTQDNTGGHILFVTPGVHLKLTPKVHLGVGFAIAAYRDLNGTQLSEDYRFVTKLAMKF